MLGGAGRRVSLILHHCVPTRLGAAVGVWATWRGLLISHRGLGFADRAFSNAGWICVYSPRIRFNAWFTYPDQVQIKPGEHPQRSIILILGSQLTKPMGNDVEQHQRR